MFAAAAAIAATLSSPYAWCPLLRNKSDSLFTAAPASDPADDDSRPLEDESEWVGEGGAKLSRPDPPAETAARRSLSRRSAAARERTYCAAN